MQNIRNCARSALYAEAASFTTVIDFLNPRAYKGWEGGFLNFFKTNYFLDLPFSLAVHISLRHILAQVWREWLLWLRDITS